MVNNTPLPSQSAASLLLGSATIHRYSTSCQSIDRLLTPPLVSISSSTDSTSDCTEGLASGAILELMGPPGIGKTRTCLAMILNARFAAIELGNNEEVLVIGESILLLQSPKAR
jgi:RecA/RadA recombinase